MNDCARREDVEFDHAPQQFSEINDISYFSIDMWIMSKYALLTASEVLGDMGLILF